MPNQYPRPRSYDEVLKYFGPINDYIRRDGTISPDWERERITRISLPEPLPYAGDSKLLVKQVAVHRSIASSASKVFCEIHAKGLWKALENYGGGYNFRTIRGRSDKLSLHSFGIAFDFDVNDNPLGSTGRDAQGHWTMHPDIVAIFEANNWFWGGKYQGRKDPMHFQYATGC